MEDKSGNIMQPSLSSENDGRSGIVDPGLLTDIERQKQVVDELERAIEKLPPEARALVQQDIQAARNAFSQGQLADATIISRISQTLGEQEVKSALQAVVGGAEALAAAGKIATLSGDISLSDLASEIVTPGQKIFEQPRLSDGTFIPLKPLS